MNGEITPPQEQKWSFLKNIIKARKSYKQPYASTPIDKKTIKEALKIAIFAPNAHNCQPWRFITFHNQFTSHNSLRKDVLNEMALEFKRDLIKDGKKPQDAEKIALNSNNRFLDAPVLILCCLDASALDPYVDAARRESEYIMGTQSLAAAITQLLLALEAKDLQACWYCAPLFAQQTIKTKLNLPESYHPQAFITTGYKKGDTLQNAHQRTPITRVLHEPSHFLDKDLGGVN